MSMQSSISYGFGLCTEDLEQIPDEALAVFARKYMPKDYWEKDVDTLSDQEILDIIEDYEDSRSCKCGRESILGDILTKETGIEFVYDASNIEDNQRAVMYYAGYPWQHSLKERQLTTEDALIDLVQPYLEELDIPDVTLDYVRIESLV